MKRNAVITAVLSGLLTFSLNAGAEELTNEFSLNFSGYPTVARMVLGSSLDAETKNKYSIPDNNVVGEDASGTPYRAHMANNSYVWDKMPDGSYEKAYGGIEGFYGYFHHENKVKTYAVTSGTTEKDSVSILNMAGNVLQISALGNSGYNLYGSFGRYDIDTSGSFVFKTTIAKMGVNNGKSTVTMSLVQNKAEDSDKCTGEYHFLKIGTDNNIYFDGSEEVVGAVKRGESFNAIPQFYDVEYYMDNSGEKPRHALVVKEAGTDTVVAKVGMRDIKQSNTSYDFTEPHGGIRVKNEGSNEWSGNARLLFKSMSFGKIQPLVMYTAEDAFIQNPISPGDENQLMEIAFSKKISEDSATADNVKLFDENGIEKTIAVLTDGDNTLRIIPEALEGTRTYTLKLTGIAGADFSSAEDKVFKVKVKDYTEIFDTSKTVDGENKKAVLKFKVKNNSASEEVCYVIVTTEDKTGKPRQGGVYFKSAKLEAFSDTDFTLNDIEYTDEEDIYRVYVIRSFKELTALGNGVIVY